IAWWAGGGLAILPPGAQVKRYLDGASGEHEISEFYDFALNPQSEDPPVGYVYSANNQPLGSPADPYPGYYANEDRAKRIVALLSARDDWTPEAVQEMALDDVSPVKPGILTMLLGQLNEPPELTPLEQKVYEELLGWDGEHSLKAVAPGVYYTWVRRVLEGAMMDELGETDFEAVRTTFLIKRSTPKLFALEKSPWWDNIKTQDQVESRQQIIQEAFTRTCQDIKALYGNNPERWTWDRFHTLEHPHILGRQKPLDKIFNVGPAPVSGGNEVINNTQFSLSKDPSYPSVHGPSRRTVLSLGPTGVKGHTILPSGNSGHAMSPYYDDQFDLYIKGAYREQVMERAALEANHSHQRRLLPE
ncbi:MAG: penicillin acylase family protein, partial [Bacteroidota bacterium]